MAWNPAKTFKELKEDPWRAHRAVATGGASEIYRGAEKTMQAGGGGVGETPKVQFGDVLTPVKIENPYEEQLKQALGQPTGPDFGQAQATAGQQAGFAKALQDLYGTGAGGLSSLIGTLQRQQAGDFGPGGSLAQKILEQGLGQNIAGVRSQLASQRGLSPALAARYAAQQTAQLGGQTAQQAGIMGLQQQLAAQQLLGQLTGQAASLGSKGADVLGQMRGQDIAQATASSDAALKRLSILASSDTGIKQLQAQTGISENELRQKIAAANQAAAAGDRQMAAQILGGILGGASQAAASVATKGMMAYDGGRIPGKAPVSGDHPANDVVKANLSPGEIVIPRSSAGSKKAAKSFIDSLDDWDEEPSYSKVLKARSQKKNYAEGGVVEPDMDKEILDLSRKKYLEKGFDAPIPGVAPMKQSLDEMLTSRVVEPMARAGYPTLGAAMATVPSTLAEALIPSTAADVAMSMLPFPKFGKLKKGISEEIAKKESKVLPEALEPISKKSYKEKDFDEVSDLYKEFEEKLKDSDVKFSDQQKEAAKDYIRERLDWMKYRKIKDFYAKNVGGYEDFEAIPALGEFKKGEVPREVSDFWLLQKEHQRDYLKKHGSVDKLRNFNEIFPTHDDFYFPHEEGYDLTQKFEFLKNTVEEILSKNRKYQVRSENSAKDIQAKMYPKIFDDYIPDDAWEQIKTNQKMRNAAAELQKLMYSRKK